MTSIGTADAVLTPELGRYRLVAALARGGMGNVYLAVAQGPGGFHKLLAVKELRSEFADDDTYVAMFLEEARLAARLTHPNIVQTNEVGSDEGRHYMVMEYLEGRSLYRLARRRGRERGLPVGAHLRVIADTLLGLHYAHELRGFDGEPAGIVHRDVSPLNVLVTFDGQAKVLDFGIAKAADSALETQAGVLKGRIAYMAPEQALSANVDRRADVYSAGVMIWEAAAGRRLWPEMSDVEILTRTLGEGAPRLRSARPDAPVDLDALCARAMAKDPNDRYPTAAALLADLNQHLWRRHDAMSMREIGESISRTFEAERQQLNAVIEEALAHTRGPARSGVMPTPKARSSGAGAQSAAHLASRDDLASIPSLLAATPSRSVAAVPPAPRRWRRERVAVVAGTLAVAGLAFGVLRRIEPVLTASQATSPPSPPTPSAIASRPEPGGTGLTVPAVTVATPVDTLAPHGPALPTRGTASPRWAPASRAPRSAPQEAARPTSPPPEAAAGSPAVARPDVDPGGGRAPLRPIVTTNPYGAQ
jgi:serine/threonine-protein kinase